MIFLRVILFFFIIMPTLLGFLGQYNFWFDLFSHFRLQYFLASLFCVFIFWNRKSYMWLTIMLTITIINITQILPYYIPQPKVSYADNNIDILLINVRSQNTDYRKVIDYVNKINPDILALQEVNDEWMKALNQLLKKYTFSKHVTRSDNFGIGIFSKIVLDSADIHYFGGVGVPSVVADFKMGGEKASIIVTHPVPPVTPHYAEQRNDQFDSITKQRHHFHSNLILLGDLNTSSWSYYFQKLLTDNALRDSRLGFGLQPTWPAFLPLLWTTIDHCLISRHWKVIHREVGPFIGSDHFPVFIKLGLDSSR